MLSFVGKEDAAIRLLRAALEHSLCVYPSVDYDPLFDKVRQSEEFKTARQAGIACQKKFAPYTRIQIPLGRIPPLRNHVVFAHSSDLKLVGPPDMSAIRRRQEV
ncbi:MAG: hypothetical protein DMG73_18450 [Acidobacteria bacterium]|nr:MAG: hypothetical protein DMG73_18450 [Acidobacteriota bacterium]